jgi:hypothetical protein
MGPSTTGIEADGCAFARSITVILAGPSSATKRVWSSAVTFTYTLAACNVEHLNRIAGGGDQQLAVMRQNNSGRLPFPRRHACHLKTTTVLRGDCAKGMSEQGYRDDLVVARVAIGRRRLKHQGWYIVSLKLESTEFQPVSQP